MTVSLCMCSSTHAWYTFSPWIQIDGKIIERVCHNLFSDYSVISDHPSAPGLSVVAVDLQTFTYTIFPLSEPRQCVLSYNITPISSDKSALVATVVVPDNEEPIVVTRSGFNLCRHTYSFIATPATFNGTGESSLVVYPPPMDSLSKCME